MKKIFVLFFLCQFFVGLLFAQGSFNLKHNNSESSLFTPNRTNESEKLRNKLNPRKPLWFPISEAIGLNLGLGAFNTYVTKHDFAKISFKTIKRNFERGFSWDGDNFEGNMFAHPFHGTIYYNLSRSSGYSFWASYGVAALGSLQWEFFMENTPPAFNDWIMTPVGGSLIGEVFYRLSNLIIDESTSGSERFWRELGAGIFNPGRLFNRLISGRTSRIASNNLYEKEPVSFNLGLGMNNVADGTNFENGEKNLILAFDFHYGDPFGKKTFKPFDTFRLYIEFNFWRQPFLGRFRLYGILAGKRISIEGGGKLVYGIFGHFDYLRTDLYQVGGVSIGGGLLFRTPRSNDLEFIFSGHLAALPMGAANSEYAESFEVEYLDEVKNYNMGPGAHSKVEAAIKANWFALKLNYSSWWIHTATGALGDEFIHILAPKLTFFLNDVLSLGLIYLLFHRSGVYDDFPDVDLTNNEQRISLEYRM